jgi:hypothetical protein
MLSGKQRSAHEMSNPLPDNDAIRRFYAMKAQGYSRPTMTDAETGEDYNVGGFMPSVPQGQH